MVTKRFFLLALTFVTLSVSAQQKKQPVKLVSPDGHLTVTTQQEGITISRDGQVAMTLPKVGIGDNAAAPVFTFSKKVKADYQMLEGKRLHCTNEANEYQAVVGADATMVMRLYNNGIAFRYELSNLNDSKMPAEQTAFLRINAFIDENGTRLNSVVSNALELKFNPYYIELKDAAPIMWYLVGDNILDGAWSNKPGESSMPMFIQSDFAYDKATGAGEITYLNWFNEKGWKIQPANFDWNYGFMSNGSANGAKYRDGGDEGGNIWCSPEGYYLVTVNTADNTCTIVPQDITPKVYDKICLAGSFNEWGDTDMTPVNLKGENHVWVYTMTVAEGETVQMKFKIAGSWDTNWGYGSADGEVNTCGKGTGGGKNIGVAEGTWIIAFNDITGEFSILPKE